MHCSSVTRLTVCKAICSQSVVFRITHLWEQITILRYAFPFTRTLFNANHRDIRDLSAHFAAFMLFAHHPTAFARPSIAWYDDMWKLSRRRRPYEYAELAITI